MSEFRLRNKTLFNRIAEFDPIFRNITAPEKGFGESFFF